MEELGQHLTEIFFGVGVIVISVFVYFFAVMVASLLADLFRKKP